MCDKAILENGGTLKSVLDCFQNYRFQEKYNKAIDNSPYALESVPECYKTQKMCDTAVDTYPSAITFVPECFVTKERCDESVNKCFFVFDSIRDQYKTQKCVTILV